MDARFLNLWMRDALFSLDKLSDVTRFVYPNSFMTRCDDTSGYDHVLSSEASQSFFLGGGVSALVVCGLFTLLYRLVGRFLLPYTIQ